MFALEIEFHDGVSAPETLLVRRVHAIVGASEFAHVVVEGATSTLPEFSITRGIGSEFRCNRVQRSNSGIALESEGGGGVKGQSFLDGVYKGEATFNMKDVTVHVTSLESDLLIAAHEAPDEAALRVLRSAFVGDSPEFPALAVVGSVPMFLSFRAEEEILIGRSRRCALRIDAPGISNEHAKVSFSEGKFWIEDLESTGGTFKGSEQINKKEQFSPEDTIVLGAQVSICCLALKEDLNQLTKRFSERPQLVGTKNNYPCVVTKSPLVQPQRLELVPAMRVSIGRDPASDIWVAATHVSNNHLYLDFRGKQGVSVIDTSTNGTYVDGHRLEHQESRDFSVKPFILDLQAGLELAICYNEEDEQNLLGEVEIGTSYEYVYSSEESKPLEKWTRVEGANRQVVSSEGSKVEGSVEGESSSSVEVENLVSGGSNESQFTGAESKEGVGVSKVASEWNKGNSLTTPNRETVGGRKESHTPEEISVWSRWFPLISLFCLMSVSVMLLLVMILN